VRLRADGERRREDRHERERRFTHDRSVLCRVVRDLAGSRARRGSTIPRAPAYVRKRINGLRHVRDNSNNSATSMTTPPVAEAAVREQLARVLASGAFARASRSEKLLTYLVEQTLAGRAHYLKEYTLGVDAFGRGADFDPRSDPIARVEASRLRSKLELYYATDGKANPVVIALPKGSYVPVFGSRPAADADAGRKPPRAARFAWLGTAAAVGAAIAVAVGSLWLRSPPEAPRALLKLDVDLGSGARLSTEVGGNLALSPDGSTLVFLALLEDGSTHLFARRLDELVARELPGTVDARAPFFSPDGRWVGFGAGGKLKKTLVAGGGSPITLVDASDPLGASWSERGEIIAKLTSESVLWRVPEDGGVPERALDTAAEGVSPRWPQVLPGGNSVLFTAMRGLHASVEAVALADGKRKTLIPSGMYGRYVASGHLVYVDGGTLFAVPFDPVKLETRGTAAPVLAGVAYSPTFGFAQFTAAANGVAAYQRGGGGGKMTVARLDAAGHSSAVIAEPAHYQWPRLSPDGRKLAIGVLEGGEFGIWVHDLATGTKARLVDGATPVWTADQRYLLYENTPSGLFALRADGAAEPVRLVEGTGRLIPWSVTPDGSRLAYYALNDVTAADLWTVPIRTDDGIARGGDPELFRRTPAYELYPTFSPDGHWLAYGSNESGSWEVYVRAFPDDGTQVRISSRGGRVPAWSKTAPEILYETIDHRLMVASYRVEHGSLVAEAPRAWSNVQLADSIVLPAFDLAPDGRSVVALLPYGEDAAPAGDRATVLVNFLDEVRRVAH